MRFRDLSIGQWFDFDAPPDHTWATGFTNRCQKVSARRYRWRDHIKKSWLYSKVGTINVDVYHVRRAAKKPRGT